MAEPKPPTLLGVYAHEFGEEAVTEKLTKYLKSTGQRYVELNGYDRRAKQLTLDALEQAGKKAAAKGDVVLLENAHGINRKDTSEFMLMFDGMRRRDEKWIPVGEFCDAAFKHVPKKNRKGLILASCHSGSAFDELGDRFPKGAEVLAFSHWDRVVMNFELNNAMHRLQKTGKPVTPMLMLESYLAAAPSNTPSTALYKVGEGIYRPEVALDSMLKRKPGERLTRQDAEKLTALEKEFPEVGKVKAKLETAKGVTDFSKKEIGPAMLVAHRLIPGPQETLKQHTLNVELLVAIRNKDDKKFDEALKNGADIRDWHLDERREGVYKSSVLSYVVSEGTPHMLAELSKKGVKLEEYDDRLSLTPLLRAVRDKNPAMAKYLVEHEKVDINKEAGGWYPVTMATYRGDAETAAVLIKAGAKLDVKDTEGQTVLHRIQSFDGRNRKEAMALAELLLKPELKLDPNAKDKDGKPPFFDAADEAHLDMLKLYQKAKADFTLVDKNRDSALDIALVAAERQEKLGKDEYLKTFRFLIEEGAPVQDKNFKYLSKDLQKLYQDKRKASAMEEGRDAISFKPYAPDVGSTFFTFTDPSQGKSL